ncbi:VOC family protein [Nocardia sp. NPDC050713]|uniref:VOC family protein n=1 Tax=unclassified Nocardia TaxID=2637762 RepID=UPI0033A541C1
MPTRDTAWPQGTPCWVDCQVDDPGRASEFYSALFGWEIDDSPPEAGGYLMASRKGSSAAGIGPKPENMAMPSVWTTYFAADSADEMARKVTAAGGTVMMPPFDVLEFGRMFVATDPTGAAFGVWESKAHTGARIYNEHGAYCWNELHTPGYRDAQRFYEAVFGYDYQEIGDGQNFDYATFTLPSGGEVVGGINDDTKGRQVEAPPHWLVWFQVDDADASLAKAAELGATVLAGPDDSPFGRMGVLQGQQGEVFAVIDPTRKVGEPPTPS